MIRVDVDTRKLELALHALAKRAKVAPGEVMRQETKYLVREFLRFTPPKTKKQGVNAIKGDLFGGRRISSARYSSVGLFQRIGSSTLVPPRSGTETVGVRLGWEGSKTIRIMRKFWMPNASKAEMRGFHKRYQNSRGRTGHVSQSSIGRWKVQDQMWVSDKSANAYFKDLSMRVGWALAGWGRIAKHLGITTKSWSRRGGLAEVSGSYMSNFGANPFVKAVNFNVKIPGYQRMIDGAVSSRTRTTEKKILRLIRGSAVNLGFTRVG